jgi:hypothetical protein
VLKQPAPVLSPPKRPESDANATNASARAGGERSFGVEESGQYAPKVKATLCPPKPNELVIA